MTDPNFMVSDLIGTAVGFILFPLFIVIPGYVCGWLLDALGFKERRLPARLAISVCLSIGISPILAYLLWQWSLLALWAVFGAMWMGFLWLLCGDRELWLSKPTISWAAVFLAITAGWILFATLSLIDLQFENRLYFPLEAFDYTFRSAVTSSITRSGVPPHNPYFFPGHAVVLRYHYFWFILCSLVNQIGVTLVSPRQAMIAGTVWCGIGLLTVIPLYLRFFQPKGPQNLARRTLISVALLGVTGLYIVLIALFDLLSRTILSTNTSIMPLLEQVLWAPHHLAALIACLVGFLLLWYRRDAQEMRANVLTCIGSGIVFASALGLSAYVTFTFVVFLAVWAIISCFKRRYREAVLICAAGVIALALCIPYMFELLGGISHQKASGGSFLQFRIRSFFITQALISSSHPAHSWVSPLINAVLLPLNYFLELGFFFLVACLQCRKMLAGGDFLAHPELCGFTIGASSVLLCTFLSSGVLTVNDLGTRGFLPAQFLFLIWGAELIDEGLLGRRAINRSAKDDSVRLSRDSRTLLRLVLVLGALGVVNDLFVFRWVPVLMDNTDIPRRAWLSLDHNLGRRTYALRSLYEILKSKLPLSAVIQHNPDTNPGDLFYGLYADRQLAAETLGCGSVFGGDPASCAKIIGPIDELFEKPAAVRVDQVDRICEALLIDGLVVKDTDPVWADRNSWIWKKQPFLANRYGRVFLCGRDSR